MSHTRVKTTYSEEGAYASTETKELYCHHNHSCDITLFYDEKGEYKEMIFSSWKKGDDLWDAMERLMYPFKDKWGGGLKDNVEYYGIPPWELEIKE